MKRIYIVVIMAVSAGALFSLPGLGNAEGSMNQSVTPDVPVGTILAYAGEVTGEHRDRLWRAGWLPCDGTTLQESQRLAVFKDIDRYWGGDKEKREYKLPDLRGRFARGVHHNQKEIGDPDAAGRSVSALGGKGGNHVGSLQGYATARPGPGREFSGTTALGGKHDRPMGRSTGNKPGSNPASGWDANAEGANMHIDPHPHAFAVTGGGDKETRPANVYVNWIIKVGPPQEGVAPRR